MSKRKEIDNISDAHAKTIVLRFRPTTYQLRQGTGLTAKDMRTIARSVCREKGKTPSELVATPLPK